MIAILLGTLLHATPATPHFGASRSAMGALRSDSLLSCDEDEEALWATPFSRPCGPTSRGTRELGIDWEENDAGSFEVADAEAPWDLASGEERDPDLEEVWRRAEE